MNNRAGCVWFTIEDEVSDSEVEKIAIDFFDKLEDKFPGGKFFLFDSKLEAITLMNKIEKAMKMSDRLVFDKEQDKIFYKKDE